MTRREVESVACSINFEKNERDEKSGTGRERSHSKKPKRVEIEEKSLVL